jgi:hypothetical protein
MWHVAVICAAILAAPYGREHLADTLSWRWPKPHFPGTPIFQSALCIPFISSNQPRIRHPDRL